MTCTNLLPQTHRITIAHPNLRTHKQNIVRDSRIQHISKEEEATRGNTAQCTFLDDSPSTRLLIKPQPWQTLNKTSPPPRSPTHPSQHHHPSGNTSQPQTWTPSPNKNPNLTSRSPPPLYPTTSQSCAPLHHPQAHTQSSTQPTTIPRNQPSRSPPNSCSTPPTSPERALPRLAVLTSACSSCF